MLLSAKTFLPARVQAMKPEFGQFNSTPQGFIDLASSHTQTVSRPHGLTLLPFGRPVRTVRQHSRPAAGGFSLRRASHHAPAAAAMSAINVTSVEVLDNPTQFGNPLQFEIQYECLYQLAHGEDTPAQSRPAISHPAQTHGWARSSDGAACNCPAMCRSASRSGRCVRCTYSHITAVSQSTAWDLV